MIHDQNQPILALVYKIFRLDDLLKKAANQITAPTGQTGARWQVLNALEDGPKTVASVARMKNSTRQSVQRIVNELVAEKIVHSKENPDHKRFPLVELTTKGKKILAQIKEQRDQWITQLSDEFEGKIEKKDIHFLERFQLAVEKSIQQGEP
jgi:DNA-binding MarR family transcriptional regulator